MARERGEAGYTILEALVAFALLSAILTAVYALIADGARGAKRATFVAEASMIAQSELDLVRATGTLPFAGSEQPVEGSSATRRVEIIERVQGPGSLAKVRITISDSASSSDLKFTLEAWIPVSVEGRR